MKFVLCCGEDEMHAKSGVPGEPTESLLVVPFGGANRGPAKTTLLESISSVSLLSLFFSSTIRPPIQIIVS